VRVCGETRVGLYTILIEDAERTKVSESRVIPVGKGE
jgi:hypothetical protein